MSLIELDDQLVGRARIGQVVELGLLHDRDKLLQAGPQLLELVRPNGQRPRVDREAVVSELLVADRIWNYWLGGKDNYAVDREAGDAWVAVHPQITVNAREARTVLQRVGACVTWPVRSASAVASSRAGHGRELLPQHRAKDRTRQRPIKRGM